MQVVKADIDLVDSGRRWYLDNIGDMCKKGDCCGLFTLRECVNKCRTVEVVDAVGRGRTKKIREEVIRMDWK